MSTIGNQKYTAKTFKLSGLNGISDKTLEMHFKLYEGYVAATNTLNEKIAELIHKGDLAGPVYGELTRRLGFEYNGMVLHEYYFENLKQNGTGAPDKGSAFLNAVESSFGSYEEWKNDFVAVGKMRGVVGQFATRIRVVVGFPIIGSRFTKQAMWQASLRACDGRLGARVSAGLQAADRPKYIEAFFQNIAWDTTNARLRTVRAVAS
jgi:Fe-Mn family superoxide dismutase